jgi:hypothetical protein
MADGLGCRRSACRWKRRCPLPNQPSSGQTCKSVWLFAGVPGRWHARSSGPTEARGRFISSSGHSVTRPVKLWSSILCRIQELEVHRQLGRPAGARSSISTVTRSAGRAADLADGWRAGGDCGRPGRHPGADHRSPWWQGPAGPGLGVTARACATAPVSWLVAGSGTPSGSGSSSSPTLQPSTAQMTSSSSSLMVFG